MSNVLKLLRIKLKNKIVYTGAILGKKIRRNKKKQKRLIYKYNACC